MAFSRSSGSFVEGRGGGYSATGVKGTTGVLGDGRWVENAPGMFKEVDFEVSLCPSKVLPATEAELGK